MGYLNENKNWEEYDPQSNKQDIFNDTGVCTHIKYLDVPDPNDDTKRIPEVVIDMKEVHEYIHMAQETLIGAYPILKKYLSNDQGGSFNAILTDSIKTAATDGRYIFFNPLFVWYLANLNCINDDGARAGFDDPDDGITFVYLHEIYHCMFLHHIREEKFGNARKGGVDHKRANIVQDQEINSQLEGFSAYNEIFSKGQQIGICKALGVILFSKDAEPGTWNCVTPEMDEKLYNEPFEYESETMDGKTIKVSCKYPTAFSCQWEEMYEYFDEHGWPDGWNKLIQDQINQMQDAIQKEIDKQNEPVTGSQDEYDEGYFDGYRGNAMKSGKARDYEAGYQDGAKWAEYDKVNNTCVNDPDYISGKEWAEQNAGGLNETVYVDFSQFSSREEVYESIKTSKDLGLFEEFKIIDKNSEAWKRAIEDFKKARAGKNSGQDQGQSDKEDSQEQINKRGQESEKQDNGPHNKGQNQDQSGQNVNKRGQESQGQSGDQQSGQSGDQQSGQGGNQQSGTGQQSGQQPGTGQQPGQQSGQGQGGNKSQGQSSGQGQGQSGPVKRHQGNTVPGGKTPGQGQGQGQGSGAGSGAGGGQGQGSGAGGGSRSGQGNGSGGDGQGQGQEPGQYVIKRRTAPSDFKWGEQRDQISTTEGDEILKRTGRDPFDKGGNTDSTWKNKYKRYGYEGLPGTASDPIIGDIKGTSAGAAAGCGKGSGVYATMNRADEAIKSTVNWQDLLMEYIKGAFKFNSMKVNKRSLARDPDIVRRIERDFGGDSIGHVAFAIDNSGSMWGQGPRSFEKFFTEIAKIKEKIGRPIKAIVTWPFTAGADYFMADYWPDAEVNPKRLGVEENGGTDFSAIMKIMKVGNVFEKKTRRRIWQGIEDYTDFPVVTVIMTDGEDEVPKRSTVWDTNEHCLIWFVINDNQSILDEFRNRLKKAGYDAKYYIAITRDQI